MHEIFVNLKRFDVPKAMGGICPADDPCAWIESVMDATAADRLGISERTLYRKIKLYGL